MNPVRQISWFLFLITFLSNAFQSSAQVALHDTIPASSTQVMNTDSRFVPHKMDYHLQVGSQFFTSSFGSGFSTFVSPSVSYGLSKRFSISGGLSLVNTTLAGKYYTPFSSEETSLNGNFTTATVFLSGQYLLNDRVTITGTAYKQFNVMGNVPGYYGLRNDDAQGMYLNVRYKVANNVHLEAGFGYSRGYNRYNPYSVFGNDPFNNTFGDPFSHPVR